MAWHPFQRDHSYLRSEVVAVCERRIRDGGVLCVEEKQRLVAAIEAHAPATLVWAPFSTGWGASPFNPRCWRSEDGGGVVPEGFAVPELAE